MLLLQLDNILPNGKLIQYNNNIYQSNLLRMLNINDYNNIIDNSIKIETGSYVGTGTYGQSNRNRLTFEFEPKILFTLSKDATGAMMTINGSSASTAYLATYVGTNRITFSGNTVSWYWQDGGNSSTYPNVQQNQSRMTYNYIAIG